MVILISIGSSLTIIFDIFACMCSILSVWDRLLYTYNKDGYYNIL